MVKPPADHWHDGTHAIGFEPSEFLEKLAAMIPKPRIDLIVYHGVFAPSARKYRPRGDSEDFAPCAPPG
jgi:hypothetical protein